MVKNSARWSAVLGACLISLVGCGGAAPTPYPGGGSGGGGGGGGSGGTSCSFGCDRGFLCQGGSCALDPTSRWVLRVTDGTVAARKASGSAWDGDGSAADPKVCLTINGSRSCTQSVQDTNSPVWNTDFPAATATALESGIAIEYTDTDFSFDDPICAGMLPATLQHFVSGSWGFVCQGGLGQVNASLIAQ